MVLKSCSPCFYKKIQQLRNLSSSISLKRIEKDTSLPVRTHDNNPNGSTINELFEID